MISAAKTDKRSVSRDAGRASRRSSLVAQIQLTNVAFHKPWTVWFKETPLLRRRPVRTDVRRGLRRTYLCHTVLYHCIPE